MSTSVFLVTIFLISAVAIAAYWLERQHERKVADPLPPTPAPEGPTDCPKCAGPIQKRGEEYVCMGGERTITVGTFPPRKASHPPCGWHAPAADHGRTWV